MDKFPHGVVKAGRLRRIGGTYALLKKLSKICGPGVSPAFLDRVMYSTQELPPLGKEYWWMLFFGRGKRPVQAMLLLFRKHGKRMLFDGKPMPLGEGLAVTAGWVYDGKRVRDLGDTSAAFKLRGKRLTSEISGRRLELSGAFPEYRVRVEGVLELRTSRGRCLQDRDAYGVLVPPFGMGWVDAYSDAEGTVLGKRFTGSAHIQKVVGVTVFGPFHWGRVVFKDGSVASFFSLKPGKGEKANICYYLMFEDAKTGKTVRFNRPRLKVSKRGRRWVIEGKDRDNEMRLELEAYAKKEYTMKGGGSQVYAEYAAVPKRFELKTAGGVRTLKELGGGVGTMEDAYW